ncbi:MAG: UvrD-helicase domain-containing protein, partial [Desulfobacterales bacterium]|nr:UvrD-helicase domain-containing protein [Desulfobacterales bacterium]
MELSDQQKAAVKHIGPALVVAGAGSGKTRTLTAKVAHLIDLNYRPERILAITFTNKAADEMKRRLTELTGLGMERFPWVRTYHSACFRILREHCRLLGYEPPLQIYSDYQ